jgi:hypothetical protein
MTVEELISELQQMDPEAEVHFAYNYGDHWHTQVAPIAENVDEGYVKHSSYHNMCKVVDEDDKDFDASQCASVVIITAR